MKLKEILFRKGVNLFLALDDKPLLRIAREVGMTYSYASKLLNAFEKEGFIDTRKRGRTREITFTTRGKLLYKCLSDAKGLLE